MMGDNETNDLCTGPFHEIYPAMTTITTSEGSAQALSFKVMLQTVKTSMR